MSKDGLGYLLDPASVAVVGASEDLGKFGGRAFHNLIEGGYEGRIVPINRARDSLRGIEAFPTIAEVPGDIDVAVLAVPSQFVDGVVGECAAAGVKACILISSNFAEAGPEGLARQNALVETARAAGMRLLGPNCLGLAVPRRGLALSPTVVFTLGGGLTTGNIALVSQSGALMTQMYAAALDTGAGFSACVSVGNQADLELVDVFEHYIDDPESRVITCYIEGLKTPARFARALARAREAGKPVLISKAGRSASGARAVTSHTASIAGEFAAFQAAAAHYGAVLFDEAEDMIRAADVISRCAPARGTRYAVVSGSGGGAVLATDKLAATEFESALLTDESVALLADSYAEPHRRLPIDLGASQKGYGPDRSALAAGVVANDPNVDCIIMAMTPQPFIGETVEAFVSAAKAAGKPVLVSAQAGLVRGEMAPVLARHNYPSLPGIDAAIRCLRAFRGLAAPVPGAVAVEPVTIPDGLPAAGALSEIEAKALLRAAGVATTGDIFAGTRDDAIVAANRLGYPVVLKAQSPTLVHKSDAGGVKVGLADDNAVGAAWDAITASLARNGFDDMAGCVVAEMASGVAEMIVGARYDPTFGPLIVIGFGGVLVEVVEDVQVALAPISPDYALTMIKRLNLWPLLDGARGRPLADVAAVAAAASRVSHLAAGLGARLVELDVNPLIVGAAGDGAKAVDGRATFNQGE